MNAKGNITGPTGPLDSEFGGSRGRSKLGRARRKGICFLHSLSASVLPKPATEAIAKKTSKENVCEKEGAWWYLAEVASKRATWRNNRVGSTGGKKKKGDALGRQKGTQRYFTGRSIAGDKGTVP